jgi:hypothetical protein
MMQFLRTISRRSFLALSAISAVAIALPANALEKQPVIVELFTSQGCSSCPPADKILGELTRQPGVIPLTLNVDYWDYLGWRDTLGSNKHTLRQKSYAANRGSRQIYTPQMVVNGHVDVVGSRRSEVLEAVSAASTTGPRVPMKISETDDKIIIDVASRPQQVTAKKATIWVMVTSPKVDVPIKRGENSGKNITYFNVVRQIIPAGMWDGKPMHIELPKEGLNIKGKRGCVALLQEGNVGKVIGVANIDMLTN